MANEILVLIFVAAVFGLTLVPIVCKAFFTVEDGTTAIVQRLGRFQREVGPGLHVLLPFFEVVVGDLSMRVQQLDVEIESKTEDGVFVRLVVAVQYSVLPDKVHDAFYERGDASEQIPAIVSDVVWAQVQMIALGDLFEESNTIAETVEHELVLAMNGSSHQIIRALVTGIDALEAEAAQNRGSAVQWPRG